MIFPKKLQPGDTVGLIAPGSPAKLNQLDLVSQAVTFLESWDLNVRLQPGYDQRHFYLAGTDQHRSEHFQAFYTDPQIKALFCTRGGYGASRMYPYLNRKQIAAHRKIIVGLSDITSLLLYLHKICGMVVFHGPNVAGADFLESPLKQKSQESLYNYLFQPRHFPTYSVESLKPGFGKGCLTGGCLSLVVTTLGTPYEIDTHGKVLFLEDVNEQPYRIDRMLTHLRNTGKLEHLQGIVFGEMVGCDSPEVPLQEVLEDFFQDDSFPIAYNFPSGHGEYSLTLPLGAEVELDTESNELRFLDTQPS